MSRGVDAGNHGHGSKWIRKAKRLRIYARDGYRCVWCLALVAPPAGLGSRRRPRLATLDHVLPRTRGGSNHHSNLVTCCAACNEARGDMPALAFAQVLADPVTWHNDGEHWAQVAEALDRVLTAMGSELPAKETTCTRPRKAGK
jgi:hypothetical protein